MCIGRKSGVRIGKNIGPIGQNQMTITRESNYNRKSNLIDL